MAHCAKDHKKQDLVQSFVLVGITTIQTASASSFDTVDALEMKITSRQKKSV